MKNLLFIIFFFFLCCTQAPAKRTWLIDIQGDPLLTEQEILEEIDRFEALKNQDAQHQIYALQEHLKTLSVIEKVHVFYPSLKHIAIEITTKKPIVQILKDDGSHYFLDAKGEIFTYPVALEIQLARGDFPYFYQAKKEKSIALEKLLELTFWIENQDFWKAQIDHLFYDQKKGFFLQTKVGMHIVELGTWKNISEIEEKMQKLYQFYTQALHQGEWHDYKHLQLQYKGQIVARKKN